MRFASSPFPETLRSLERDRPLRLVLGIATMLILSALWLAWLVTASIPVFVTTSSAQLRAADRPLQIVAEVDGRVEALGARLGTEVAARDVLLILDTQAERLQLGEISSAESALELGADALESELGFRRRALERALVENRHAVRKAAQEGDNARLAAKSAAEDFARTSALAEQGLVSESEAQHDEAIAEQLAAAQKASEAAVEAIRIGGERVAEDLRAEIAALERQVAETHGDLQGVRARRAIAEDEIARHTLRTPSSGRLADIQDFAIGAAVSRGDYVATLLTDEGLSAVGWFPVARGLARIREGQTAELRIDGFPWTEYGALRATVQRVAGEARDGQIRVECQLADSAASSVIPLEHGLRGSLIIEIERASPFSLLLRSVGKRLLRIGSTVEHELAQE